MCTARWSYPGFPPAFHLRAPIRDENTATSMMRGDPVSLMPSGGEAARLMRADTQAQDREWLNDAHSRSPA